MKNPRAALDAFTRPLTTPVGPYAVQELTLGLAAVLESIASPVMTGRRPKTLAGWAGTLYAFTRPTAASRELLAAAGPEGYEARALEWSDTLPLRLGRQLIEATTAALERLNAVSADSGEAEEADAGGNPTAAGPTAGS